MTLPLCPSLPSAKVAYELVSPNPRALPGVVGTLLFRATLIAGGLRLAHGRWPPTVLRDSLVASSVIETFVIGWAIHQTARYRALTP